jgi:hypothetical protein
VLDADEVELHPGDIVVQRGTNHAWSNRTDAPVEGACARCDFRPVCGPDVGRRVSRKPRDPLADLLALRSRP